MKWDNDQVMRLLSIRQSLAVPLSREEELRMQEEFIARNGVKRLPQVAKEADFERWQRISDFKRELREKYQRQEAAN